MLPAYASLLLSIVSVIFLLRIKLHPGYAIFAGAVVISLFTIPFIAIPSIMFEALWNFQTLQFLVVMICALSLARLMELCGFFSRLAKTMETISPKLAIHMIPALIGFVPMPAGALISAGAVQEMSQKMNLTPAQGAFINYWFRHLWEFFLPVYPSVIALGIVLHVQLSYLILLFFPMSILTIIIGSIASYKIMKRVPGTRIKIPRSIVKDILIASWPIILLMALVAAGVESVIAFPATLLVVMAQQRAKWQTIGKSLRYGLGPLMLLMLYSIMLYKTSIESSNIAFSFLAELQSVSLPSYLIMILLPFIVCFITGSSTAAVGVAFPLLIPFLVTGTEMNSPGLLLAYMSAMLGLMVSPVHLCLVLSVRYFKTSFSAVYRYLTPLYGIIGIIVLIIYFLWR